MRFSDRVHCHVSQADPFGFLLSHGAEVLGKTLRRIMVVGAEFEEARVSTP